MKVQIHPHGAALFAALAVFAITAAGVMLTVRNTVPVQSAWLGHNGGVLPTLTDITPKTFTEGQMVVGADSDYHLPPVVAVYGTGIYPAMPPQPSIQLAGSDESNKNTN